MFLVWIFRESKGLWKSICGGSLFRGWYSSGWKTCCLLKGYFFFFTFIFKLPNGDLALWDHAATASQAFNLWLYCGTIERNSASRQTLHHDLGKALSPWHVYSPVWLYFYNSGGQLGGCDKATVQLPVFTTPWLAFWKSSYCSDHIQTMEWNLLGIPLNRTDGKEREYPQWGERKSHHGKRRRVWVWGPLYLCQLRDTPDFTGEILQLDITGQFKPRSLKNRK